MTKTRSALRSTDNVVPAASLAAPVDRRVDEAAAVLGRLEQRMLNSVRQRGALGFVAAATFVVVLASAVLTTLAMIVLFGLDGEVLGPAVLLAMAVPAMVAPPVLILMVRLTVRLDAAGVLLRRAALTDPLTGVLNRRGFFAAVDDLDRPGSDLKVGMVDVDDFKRLNDRHGHATGDVILKHVADWLMSAVGESGVVSRMGGDEFAFVVTAVQEPRLPSRQSLVVGGIDYRVTIGCSQVDPAEDFDQALARADADLYELKRAREV